MKPPPGSAGCTVARSHCDAPAGRTSRPFLVASTSVPFTASVSEVAAAGRVTPDQAVAGCCVQVAPLLLEVKIVTPPNDGPMHATASWVELCRASSTRDGRPLAWAGPGWQATLPCFDHSPPRPTGPEYSVPSGATRYPVASVTASTAEVGAPASVRPFVEPPTGTQLSLSAVVVNSA